MKRGEYLAKLRERSVTSRVYRKYQLDGLEIAKILGDEAHKALYIKLAKERDAEALRGLAKSVSLRRGVKNRGALFMYLLSGGKKSGARMRSPKPQTRRRNRA